MERIKWVGKSTLTTIGDYAFYKCASLNNLMMPNSVLSVGNYSFRYYSGLADVSLSSTLSIIYEYAFGECGFSHIILPESLVSKSLSMPKTIDHINDNIIYSCSALKDVYCYVEDVPAFIGTHDSADMDDVFKSATLHVL